jgi:hypothetical protein
MKTRSPVLLVALSSVIAPAVLFAAFAVGGTAYTKRAETSLLAEPQPLAATVARVGYAQDLKVEELRGAWLRVTDGKSGGWVFGGNLAEEKPSEVRGLDGLPIEASETTATTAARPLSPAAEEYSARRGLTSAADDLVWLNQQAVAVTAAEVKTFLQEQKKGEFK